MSAIIQLKRVKEFDSCYVTHDNQYMVQRRDDEYWYWAVRIGTSPSYQTIDDNSYRTRKDCMYALKDYIQEQLQEEKLWGE